MTSTDVIEIQDYLKQAHPDDPKNPILKKKIIELKNRQWTSGSAHSKPMAARPVNTTYTETGFDLNDFERLLEKDEVNYKNKTANLLTEMFNNDKNSPNAILVVRNHSPCNTILHIEEKGYKHDLAIPFDGENFIVLEKGTYHITGNICGANYEKIKNIDNSIYLTLK